MMKDNFRKVILQTVPIMAGYIVLGFGFGLLLNDKGYNFLWALLMSTSIYAGSMQYVAIDLLSSGASIISAIIMTLMVNARHVFYGISMVDKYRDTKPYRPYLIYALTDETYSLVCHPEPPEGMPLKKYYFIVSLLNQSYWVLGSVLGALAGSMLQFDSTGVDFAMTALFVVIFVEQWEQTKNHLPALLGLFISIISLLIFKADNFLIPTMILITACLFLFKNKIEREKL